MKEYKIQNRSQKNSHSCIPLKFFTADENYNLVSSILKKQTSIQNCADVPALIFCGLFCSLCLKSVCFFLLRVADPRIKIFI